jgi:hypothetical protein
VKSSVRFNTRLLTTSTFDSGALGLLVHLIHRFPQAGTYQAVVFRDGERVGTTCFRVTAEGAGTQLNIDLASVAPPAGGAKCTCREHPESAPVVSPEGYVLFHAPRGIGSYAVVVGEAREGAPAVFDSRSLTDGDLFALALIEPTTYRLESPGGSAKGEIAVAPIPPGTDLRTVAPVYVDATKEAFQPAQVNVHAGQGIVFRARGAKRIVITKSATPQRPGAAAPAAPGARRVRRHVRVWRRGVRRNENQS